MSTITDIFSSASARDTFKPAASNTGLCIFRSDTKAIEVSDGTNYLAYNNDGLSLIPFNNTYSLDFDGSNEHATLGTSVLFDTTTAFSASFWLKLDTYTNGYPYLLCLKTDLTQPFIIGASNQTNYQGIYFGIPTNTVDLSTKSTAIQNALLTDWHHICVTYNGNGEGVDGNYKLYYDGTEQTLFATSGLGSITNTNYFARASASTNYTDGKLDEISIYNTQLTLNQVTSIYNNGVAGVDLDAFNPLGWWRMGDASGDTWDGTNWTIVNNASGNNSLGSSVNATTANMEQADRTADVAS